VFYWNMTKHTTCLNFAVTDTTPRHKAEDFQRDLPLDVSYTTEITE